VPGPMHSLAGGGIVRLTSFTWGHGFYELRKRFCAIMEEAQDMIKNNRKAYRYPNFPGAGGSTQVPWGPPGQPPDKKK
jgi:hydroxylamine dehydrogenase